MLPSSVYILSVGAKSSYTLHDVEVGPLQMT